MNFDIDFILSIGKTLSLLFVIIFVEGVLAGRPDGKWPGFIFAAIIAGITVIVGLVSRNLTYFLLMLIPTVLCFLAYGVSRRNVARGGGYHPEDEEQEQGI